MKNNDPKSIAALYKTKRIIALLLLFCLWVVLIIQFKSILLDVLLYFVLIVVTILTTGKIYLNNIQSILIKNFDPFLFREVLEAGRIASLHANERIIAAFYCGDYQSVIDICTLKLNDKKLKQFKLQYLLYLARTYFELRDTENLRRVCNEFDEYAASSKNGKKIKEKYMVFGFYSAYLSRDFSLCKERYEKAFADNKMMKNKFNQAHTRYTYALICYECGDFNTALDNFNYVIGVAEKLNIAKTAEKYINAINKEREYKPEPIMLTPTEDFSMPLYKENKKKALRALITTWIIVIAVGAAIVLLSVFSVKNTEKKAKEAASRYYEGVEIVRVDLIKYEDDTICNICVCSTESDGIVIGTVYRHVSTKAKYFYEGKTQVKPGEEYKMRSFPSGYELTVKTYSDAEEMPEDTYFVTLVGEGDEAFWICVTDIGPWRGEY